MSEQPKFTSGPWPQKYTGDGKRILIGDGLVEGPNGYEVAEVYSDDCPQEVAEANAHLIASAPDLYAALRGMADAYVALLLMKAEDPAKFRDPGSPYAKALAALSKAEGHQ